MVRSGVEDIVGVHKFEFEGKFRGRELGQYWPTGGTSTPEGVTEMKRSGEPVAAPEDMELLRFRGAKSPLGTTAESLGIDVG